MESGGAAAAALSERFAETVLRLAQYMPTWVAPTG